MDIFANLTIKFNILMEKIKNKDTISEDPKHINYISW
jgi:hypothetical protein